MRVLKASAWVIAGAVLATAGVAHAQDGAASAVTVAPAPHDDGSVMPWFERFTTSTGVAENITGFNSENDRAIPPSWTLSQRWNVTLNMQQAQRVTTGQDHVAPPQTAVGAYYQFTPRVRLGGEVSIQNRDTPLNAPAGTAAAQANQPAAGVKLESAFRF